MLAHMATADVTTWMTAVGTVGAALGTVAAVAVALWLAWRGDRRAEARRPSLSVAFDEATGLVNETVTYTYRVQVPGGTTEHMSQGRAAHFRLEVTNAAGRDAAEDVEVLLSGIFTMTPATKEFEIVEISFPGFPWTHLDTTRLTIPAGVTRTIDVARVHETPPDPSMADVFELLVQPTPGDFRNRLKKGAYELHLTVSARNTDAAHYVTSISFDPKRARTRPDRSGDAAGTANPALAVALAAARGL